MDDVPTQYTLDLNASLTQVIADGTNTYLHGVNRIGQQGASGWAHNLPDALGSVRQVADPEASVALVRAYEPFGSQMLMAGPAPSPYGFAGEWGDQTGLLHLRARHYDPSTGRFINADPFAGLPHIPPTLHPYVYARNNPVLYVDPNGEFAFIPLLLVAAAGGFLGGIGYYALQPILYDDPCWQWDWIEAALWSGVGTGLGAITGTAIYGGWWVGAQVGWWGPTVATTAAGPGAAKAIDFVFRAQHWFRPEKQAGWDMIIGPGGSYAERLARASSVIQQLVDSGTPVIESTTSSGTFLVYEGFISGVMLEVRLFQLPGQALHVSTVLFK